MNIRIIDFSTIRDERGALSFFEVGKNKQIPFEIKRIYYLYNLNEKERGFHAHKDLQQIMICISGSCSVMFDDGKEKKLINLSKPNQGVFVDKMIWREIRDASAGTVIVVLASEYYDESDYIRNYDEFLSLTK